MANVQTNVAAGRPKSTGGAYHGVAGTALPTDSFTALNAAFKSLGYISDAGVTKTINRETKAIQAWGTDTVKTLQTNFSVTYQLTLIEALSAEAAKAVFGSSNVTTTAPGVSHGNQLAIAGNSAMRLQEEFVFEVLDGIIVAREVVPNAQIIDIGDIVYSDGDVIAYPITIQAYPDSSGNFFYFYSDDGLHT